MTISAYAQDPGSGLFLPKSALYPQKKKKRLRGYDAANTYSASGEWKSANKTTVNQEVKASRIEVTARMRQLNRDFPPMAKATRAAQDYTVGTGVKLQMTLKKPNGDLDTDLNQQIENDFERFTEEADFSGRSNYYALERMKIQQTASEAGECLVIKHYPKNKPILVPFQIQPMETDWLDTAKDTPFVSRSSGTYVSQGIKYNALTGEVLGYWLKDQAESYSFSYTSTFVPAAAVIHCIDAKRFGQERGISPFTSGMQIADSFFKYLDAESDRALIAARQIGVVETDKESSVKIHGATTDDNDDEVLEFEGAMFEYLGAGQKMNWNKTPNIGNNFGEFVKTLHRWLAIATNKPYHLISGDLSDTNYVSLRMSVNELKSSIDPDLAEHIRQWSNPITREWMRIGVLSGALELPGFFDDPWRYYRAMSWQGPGRQELDPLKEAKAYVVELENGLRSQQEIIRARGGDPDKVFAQLAEAKNVLEEAGLILAGNTSTASAGNPAAVAEQ